ncbi:glycosyl hydrolase family 28-related protein [Sphingomonas psychrotolerans]|uniref:Rhamnogalacturonase A/B/Epimerase-like pectate lyase domain-containing protein n=1 Tax=Sphingomonas psychrotolerans TaxID=1327635 RepID=A0A2K8MN33_9SPHN|nr:glycosyl hydrolase family 28-related protein [Sphingomonas psychrotolerans]ATY33339.1 hypothetical protein CVN68_16345 [Sphingomonas psychrotolerans]
MTTSVDVTSFGAVGDGITDDSAAFAAALGSTASQIIVPPGIYCVENVQLPAGKHLQGAGPGQTTLKIVSGSSYNILTASLANSVAVTGMTLDDTGATGTSHGLFVSQCADVLLLDISTRNTPGHGIWLYDSPRARVDRIFIEAAGDWGMHVGGGNSVFSTYSNIHTRNCATIGVRARDCALLTFSNISGSGNGGDSTTMSFYNANWCLASNITEYDGALGDTVVIAGDSIGTWIRGVTAKNGGGHGASISATETGAPVDCHIVDAYFENQGECLGCITDQGEGNQPSNCSIRNVRGRNPGTVNPSEAFAISNAVNCVITGSVIDTQGNMLYAVQEHNGVGSSANNRFEIDNWVPGTSGYFSLASPTSTIVHTRLERGYVQKSDVDYNWDPAVDARQISFDAPLTANRNLVLAPSWSGDRVRVVRSASGSFTLAVKQGGTTLKILNAAGDWVELYFDGTNWRLAADS